MGLVTNRTAWATPKSAPCVTVKERRLFVARPTGIALVGQPGSGKSSIADALVRLVGGERLSFAGALKDEVAEALGYAGMLYDFHRARMNDPATKDEYRSVLQAWGSFRRAQDEDYWVRIVTAGIKPDQFYVVDDCRYFNEEATLRRYGFKFVLLEPGETTRPLTGEQAEHASEKDWPEFKVDLLLGYERGPEAQAERIARVFGL